MRARYVFAAMMAHEATGSGVQTYSAARATAQWAIRTLWSSLRRIFAKSLWVSLGRCFGINCVHYSLAVHTCCGMF